MNPYLLIAALKLRGKTQTEVAQELGVSAAAVHRVIFSKGKSLRIATHVAALAGVTLESAWPGVYAAANAVAPIVRIVPDKSRRRSSPSVASRPARRAA